MTLTTRRGGRALAAVLAPHLDRWAQQRAVLGELHSGDLGWHLRFPDERVAGSVLVWEKDGEPVAAGLLDGQDLLPAVSPEHAASEELAAAMATTSAGLTSVDASDGTLLRDVLLGQGWTVDPLEWVVLLADLGPGHATDQDPGTRELDGPADVEARVAVQRSAFSPGSTFTAALWEQMASGPTYDRRFDLVTWTPDGRPAAAATGWFAGPDRDPGTGRHARGPSAAGLRRPGQPRGDGRPGPRRRERGAGAHAGLEPGCRGCLRVVRAAAREPDDGGHPDRVSAVGGWCRWIRAGSTSGSGA